MLKRLCASLIMVIVAYAGGVLVGHIVGSILYERAQEGTALRAAIGLGIGIGEAVWAEMKEPEAERE
jgi:hypothetical protein